jgi:hypothetical protein
MNLADKAGVVGQLWIEFRNDEDFDHFMEYNDIGCPMGYMLAEGIVKELTPLGEEMLEETFKMFLSLINISEEEVDGLENQNLPGILEYAYNKKNNE